MFSCFPVILRDFISSLFWSNFDDASSIISMCCFKRFILNIRSLNSRSSTLEAIDAASFSNDTFDSFVCFCLPSSAF